MRDFGNHFEHRSAGTAGLRLRGRELSGESALHRAALAVEYLETRGVAWRNNSRTYCGRGAPRRDGLQRPVAGSLWRNTLQLAGGV